MKTKSKSIFIVAICLMFATCILCLAVVISNALNSAALANEEEVSSSDSELQVRTLPDPTIITTSTTSYTTTSVYTSNPYSISVAPKPSYKKLYFDSGTGYSISNVATGSTMTSLDVDSDWQIHVDDYGYMHLRQIIGDVVKQSYTVKATFNEAGKLFDKWQDTTGTVDFTKCTGGNDWATVEKDTLTQDLHFKPIAKEGVAITGTVLDDDGEGISAAHVIYYASDGSNYEAYTDSAGAYSITVPSTATSGDIAAYALGYKCQIKKVVAGTTEYSLTLSEIDITNAAKVSGTVYVTYGDIKTPVDDAVIMLYNNDTKQIDYICSQIGTSATEDNFSMIIEKGSSYTIQAYSEGYQQYSENLGTISENLTNKSITLTMLDSGYQSWLVRVYDNTKGSLEINGAAVTDQQIIAIPTGSHYTLNWVTGELTIVNKSQTEEKVSKNANEDIKSVTSAYPFITSVGNSSTSLKNTGIPAEYVIRPLGNEGEAFFDWYCLDAYGYPVTLAAEGDISADLSLDLLMIDSAKMSILDSNGVINNYTYNVLSSEWGETAWSTTFDSINDFDLFAKAEVSVNNGKLCTNYVSGDDEQNSDEYTYRTEIIPNTEPGKEIDKYVANGVLLKNGEGFVAEKGADYKIYAFPKDVSDDDPAIEEAKVLTAQSQTGTSDYTWVIALTILGLVAVSASGLYVYSKKSTK